MVHALREIHRALRSHGVLLDVHPHPRHPAVEVRRGGERVRIGHVDWTEDCIAIRDARRRLVGVQRDGLFAPEATRTFTLERHYDDVEEWLRVRDEEGATRPVPAEVVAAARRELERGGELVTRISVRARRLRKT